MKIMSPDWYKKIWSLDIKSHSWVEDTENEVNFIINTLSLSGQEKILDLACGFGRHSISFAQKGYSVVGVDITKDYIDDAIKTAGELELEIDFICDDIRNLKFNNEFDVVLNLADGAIGYLENDEENLKIFDMIAKSLKPSGKHFMDICSADHAQHFFPKRHWDIGNKSMSLSEFDWISETKRMLYSQWDMMFGQIACKPDSIEATTTRLYTISELDEIFQQRHMKIIDTYSDYRGQEYTFKNLQLMVYSEKTL